MNKVEILPCPICGSESVFIPSISETQGFVRCKNMCVEQHFSKPKEQAINEWNVRKPVEDVLERLEEKAKEYTNDDLSYRIPWFGMDEAIGIIKEGIGQCKKK